MAHSKQNQACLAIPPCFVLAVRAATRRMGGEGRRQCRVAGQSQPGCNQSRCLAAMSRITCSTTSGGSWNTRPCSGPSC